MKCPEIEQLAALQTGALDAAHAERINTHVSACEACRRELAALETVVRTVSSLPAPAMPPDLWQGVAARIAVQPRRQSAWWRALTGAGVVATLLVGSALSYRWVSPTLPTASGDASVFVTRHELLSAQDPLADRASFGVMLISQEEQR